MEVAVFIVIVPNVDNPVENENTDWANLMNKGRPLCSSDFGFIKH